MASLSLGLISDTHQPQRMLELPRRLPELFHGVQLILHAGDVGDLGVLDQLGTLAPVVAVHGNDDSAEAQRELPERLLLSCARHRLLLWHSHYARLPDEKEFRKTDDWTPKLRRLAAHAQAAGADIVVSGHTHIPTALNEQGVLLLNPGALASGNPFSVQCTRTVARLTLTPGQTPQVQHFNADTGEQVDVTFNPQDGFLRALQRFSRSIFAPDVQVHERRLRHLLREHQAQVLPLYFPLAHRVWTGQQESISRNDLMTLLRQAQLPEDTQKQLRQEELL